MISKCNLPVHGRQQGFSVFEALVALLLVSVGLAGMMKLQAYLNTQTDNALLTLSAVNQAESALEALRGQPEYPPEARQETLMLYNTPVGLEVSAYQNVPVSRVTRVVVSVRWQDRWMKSHLIEIETYINPLN